MKRHLLILITAVAVFTSCDFRWFGEPPHGPGPGYGNQSYYTPEYENAKSLMPPAHIIAWFYDYYHANESQDSYIIHFYGGSDSLIYALSFVPNKRTSIVGCRRLGENKLTWLEIHNGNSVIKSKDGYFEIKHTGNEIIMDKLTGEWGCLPKYRFYGYATMSDNSKVKWNFEKSVSAADSYLYNLIYSLYETPTEDQLGQAVIVLQD